uniref:Fibronectin type-III domain-containing protein n=1 Tax=Timema douglasi TaxID=61478 RepID=A0A7R8VW99_TIMDO|nr:unnamed protein product [Timema douglasi]
MGTRGPRSKGGFSTKHEVTGLGPEDCYHFRLKATTHLGESPWSTVLAATTKDDHVPTVSLYRAIQNGQPQLVRKILSNRPMVVDVHDHMGMSPLMRATSRGDAQMVTLLLNAGADVNTVSVGAGRSALMVACFQGHVDVAHLLRERGAHWYLRDSRTVWPRNRHHFRPTDGLGGHWFGHQIRLVIKSFEIRWLLEPVQPSLPDDP